MWFLPTRLAQRGVGGSIFPGCVKGEAAYGLPLSKYPVQWVAPTSEAEMFLKESLYPKKGYRVASMLLPRQYMKHPTNGGRYFGAWRYAEDRATQAQLAAFLVAVWMFLALTTSGGTTNKSWRGHAENNFWFGEKHDVLKKIEGLHHNLGRMAR